MAIQIQFRRGTATQWTSANPVLADGEVGIERDTSQFKVGDGTTAWNSLAYGGIKGDLGNPGPAPAGTGYVHVTNGELDTPAATATPSAHSHVPADVTGTAIITTDSRLSDARQPTAHTHAESDVTSLGTDLAEIVTDLSGKAPASHGHIPSDVTGTAVITTDSRLSDARTPLTHSHAPGDVTGTAVITTDARLSDVRTPTTHDSTKHSVAYALPSDISTHSGLSTGVHGAGANSLIYSNDTRLSDARTPVAHNQLKATITDFAHTHPESEVTNLATDLAAKAPLVSPSFTTPNIGVATGTSLAATGALTSSGGGVGYASGAGGTVTQSSSKSTGVTLNKFCGTITMNGAALANATTVSFTLTNSMIAAGDIVVVQHSSVGTLGAYNFAVAPAAGSAVISVRNVHTASLSEAIVLRFLIIKAVTA